MENENLENVLSNYVAGTEAKNSGPTEIKASTLPIFDDTKKEKAPEQQAPSKVHKMRELEKAQEEKKQEIRDYQEQKSLGYVSLPIKDLPTRGMFYPDGFEIFIRAASGGEIRHWSMTNEEEISDIDDALNYMLERCMTVRVGDMPGSWKDLKDIDRLYVILAIRDFTFTEGNNELKIKIDEKHEEVVNKDSIDFISLPDNLMKHYSQEDKCFVFQIPKAERSLNIYLPSVGVSSWLKNYVQTKSRKQEGFDKDFVTIAPMLIKDYKSLNNKSYEEFVVNCFDFGVYEYSLIAKVKDLFSEALDPKFRYKDEDGAEQTAPLNFLGGIKGFFLLDLGNII